ncbi:hypothetical protein ACFOWX_11820 [Sphingorhabdus arenilitoris]|uniref:Uncharacterized protein n=1 Tax=Sphingorhabdus arenilitoris TaxID=1490041 RepID=A0ABV8RI82_9SPHN
MSPDNAIIIFMSLGLAAVFLALVIGMDNQDAERIMENISGLTPKAKRAARNRKLEDMTKLADDAIKARDMGERMPPPLQRY